MKYRHRIMIDYNPKGFVKFMYMSAMFDKNPIVKPVSSSGSFFQPNIIQLSRQLDPDESKECIKKVENTIKALEKSSQDESKKLPDYIKKAIKLLRERMNQNKIKCYAFEGIKHGTVDYEKKEIHVDGLSPDWINETTLLHEGIHALHGEEHSQAALDYQKAQKDQKKIDLDKPTAQDLEFLKFKAWTEYWAYRSRHEYYNQSQKPPKTEDEIDQATLQDRDVRVSVNRVRIHDKTFDPKNWKPK